MKKSTLILVIVMLFVGVLLIEIILGKIVG
jgi:hypothetical protein